MQLVPSLVLSELSQAYDLAKSSLVKFGGGEEGSDGVVYLGRNLGQSPVLLKVCYFEHDGGLSALRNFKARLAYLDYLNQRDIPVIEVIPSPQGRFYEVIEDDRGVWAAYVMNKAPGEQPSPKVWDCAFFRQWGALLGRLHRASMDYPDWPACEDPESGESYLTWEGEWMGFYEMCEEQAVSHQWEILKDQLSSLPISRTTFGFVHNDPHIWNLRQDEFGLTLLDFDVANFNWFASDIAIACQHVLMMLSGGLHQPVHHPERLTDFLVELIRGYKEEHSLGRDWISQLNLFFNYRRILLYLVMGGWRASDPSLQRGWKEMILNPPILIPEGFSAGNLLEG